VLLDHRAAAAALAAQQVGLHLEVALVVLVVYMAVLVVLVAGTMPHVLGVCPVEVAQKALCVLSGPDVLVHSHQQTQGTYK